MALQTIVIAPPGTLFAAGTTPFGPVSVPTGVFSASAHVDVAILLSTTLILTAGFELSQDSGVVWQPWGSAGRKANGIIPLGKNGLPQVDWFVVVPLPNPSNPNRQLRGFVTINEAVTTFLRVVLES